MLTVAMLFLGFQHHRAAKQKRSSIQLGRSGTQKPAGATCTCTLHRISYFMRTVLTSIPSTAQMPIRLVNIDRFKQSIAQASITPLAVLDAC